MSYRCICRYITSYHTMEHKINLCNSLRHEYFDNEYKFSELTIITSDNEVIYCPANILAAESTLVSRELDDGNNIVEVDVDADNVFLLLDYIYLDIADIRDNFCKLYETADIMECDDIRERISYYIRLNYEQLCYDIGKLEMDVLCEILDNDFINVINGGEDIIFESIVGIESLTSDDRDRLVKVIRFNCLTDDCLTRASKHPLMNTNEVFRKLVLAEAFDERKETYLDQRKQREWPPAKICEQIQLIEFLSHTLINIS